MASEGDQDVFKLDSLTYKWADTYLREGDLACELVGEVTCP